jgi:hypothetical protein
VKTRFQNLPSNAERKLVPLRRGIVSEMLLKTGNLDDDGLGLMNE